ncbi:MAG: type II toxin-antitoxin system RelE/ParE family toxin [Phycisphaerales bacterium]|nr:type II toxin-antitoxin system RelE/ParE family toxin [Phycisphaerales bacterium]
MRRVHKTLQYSDWIADLRDPIGRAAIQMRVDRLADGNPGLHRVLRHGVHEMKIDVGPGYRVYYKLRGSDLVVLLAGGDKSTQERDIVRAYYLTRNL